MYLFGWIWIKNFNKGNLVVSLVRRTASTELIEWLEHALLFKMQFYDFSFYSRRAQQAKFPVCRVSMMQPLVL